MVQSFPDRSIERTSILSILLLVLGLSLCVVSQSTAQSQANAPKIEHIGPVAPDVLALKIQAGHFENPGQRPYEKQPGDQIRLSDKQVLAWQEGEIVSTKKDRHLYRDIDDDGEREEAAEYTEVYGSWTPKVWSDRKVGRNLSRQAADDPNSYRVSSAADSDYADGVPPTTVHRKTKPNDKSGDVKTYEHVLYLKLPESLENGARYEIEFPGLNLAASSVAYTHEPRETRSPALHVTQVGYRPSDPFKRGYLSLWRGNGGGHSYEDVDQFEILHAETGEAVYSGNVELGFPEDRPEQFSQERNFVKADVYYLNFHDFDQQGRYRLYVPGVGTSFPFRIEDGRWTHAFQTSMHGLLSHRSGIELGEPFTDYERPRPMHPKDGFKVFELNITRLEGEAAAVLEDLHSQLGEDLDPSNLATYNDAWGGYMDAGDWDRRSQHLNPTYVHLELLEMYPEHFEIVSLALPPSEANDNLPDLLNEALWNVDFYRRLQREHGGVGGGVESTAHPRPGETSWQETLLLGTYAPDPVTSYNYAACAARVARLMEPYAPGEAKQYLESAKEAFSWAAENGEDVLIQVQERSPDEEMSELRSQMQQYRIRASLALYRTTETERYHRIFKEISAIGQGRSPDSELHETFAYAMLPDNLADASLKKTARDAILDMADRALDFQDGNAFSLASRSPDHPMMGYAGFYSVPEMSAGPTFPRAYYLTGETKYLRGAVAAANYSAGANPMNMTLTTGLGHQHPKAPLHIDHRMTGQEPPRGITVYGPMDPKGDWDFNAWVHKYHLDEMTPGSRQWPAVEWYIDIYIWPAMTEYTVHQTIGRVSYYWGFLSAYDRSSN